MQTNLIPAEQAADLSHVAPDAQPSALTDLRQRAMAVPTAVLQAALAEYVDRRDTLREWLLAQMKEGIHYGVPPGCEPKGNVNERQWKHKPSLYKAGAELVIDLMGLRQVYEPDLIGWQQLGSEKGTAVYKCRLLSRSTGDEVGQGIGAGKVGRKGADENKAVKDAQKRAMVAAVLNAYGLSDLYVADLEDYVPPANENPERRPGAPQVEPRGKRTPPEGKPSERKEPYPKVVTIEQIQFLKDHWKETVKDPTPDGWSDFVQTKTGRLFDVGKSTNWTFFDVRTIREALEIPTDADLEGGK